MNNLKEKPRGVPSTSWLIYPVTANTAALSDYLNRNGNGSKASFVPKQGFLYDDDEPLPSMFRTNRLGHITQPRASRAQLWDTAAKQPSKPHSWNTTRRYFHQIAIAFCIACLASAAVHSTAATPSLGGETGAGFGLDSAIAAQSPTANRAVIESTAFAAFRSAPGKQGKQIHPATPWQATLVDSGWRATVEQPRAGQTL
jgi:hypothetical protein